MQSAETPKNVAFIHRDDSEVYRLSILTHNIWRPYPLDGIPLDVDIKTIDSNQRWDRAQYPRKDALLSFLTKYSEIVDIFFLQEVTKEVIDAFLTESTWTNNFDYIDQTNLDHVGTTIFWNKYLFTKIDGNALEIDGADMSWVKLRYKQGLLSNIPIICVSLHLTYQGRYNETEYGYNPRIGQMKAILNYIQEIKQNQQTIVFIAGDLNDHFHPIGIAKLFGYNHAYYDLGRVFPKTFPTPAAVVAKDGPDLQSEVTYDWIMVNNKNTQDVQVKCMMADILQYNKAGVYPSDHYPVMAIYQINS